MTRSHSFWLRSFWLSAVGSLALLPAGLSGQKAGGADAPPATVTPFRRPGEGIEQSRSTEIDILETVLTFYRPSGDQSRWLDAERLPPSEGATVQSLDADVIAELTRRLGSGRFCASDGRDACRSMVGGGLRVSPVYRSDAAHARVAVRFQSAWPAAPTVANIQVFALERRGSRWQIVSRATAAPLP